MWLYLLIPFALLLLLFIYDGLIQKKHTIIRNFPIVGRMRYLLEELGPPLRQYWIANDKEEQPFHRDERRWVYASAKGENKNFGFGTTEQLYKIGHPIIKHSTFPVASHTIQPFIEGDPSSIPCAKVMGEYHKRAKPFHPQSIINISAMSFGSLGEKAVRAMGLGAKNANAFHNTGEGGVSDHHKASNADLIWQLGTGYYGARDDSGRFSLDVLLFELYDMYDKIAKADDFGLPRYKHIFVDEFQDFSWVQLKLISKMLEENRSVTLAGDFHQSLSYNGIKNIKGIYRIFSHHTQSYDLRKNLRQKKQIREWTTKFRILVQKDADNISGNLFSTQKPTRIHAHDINTVIKWKHNNPQKTICIIVSTDEKVKEFHRKNRSLIETSGYTTKFSLQTQSSLHENHPIHISTPYPTKGLEFDLVWIVDMDAYDLEQRLFRDLLYVALSRPKEALYFSTENDYDNPILQQFLIDTKDNYEDERI